MSEVRPRLVQPLFSKNGGEFYSFAEKDPVLFTFIRAYDAIYNLVYAPDDMSSEDILLNAEINLEAIGTAIEKVIGEKAFQPITNQGDTK